MVSPSSQTFESYVPVYDAIPDAWEEARPLLVEQMKAHANAINIREIGWLLDEELLSGKQFIPTAPLSGQSDQYRSVLRKVIDFGPLPDNATKTVPHGITFDANFTLIDMWAAATDPVNFVAFNIPFVGQNVPTSIALLMDAINVIITTHDVKSQFTRVFVFIEYIQEI